MKTEISHVKLDNGQEIPVVEEGREGSTVFVRPIGEKEIDRGETVTFDPKEEHLVPTIPVYWATLQKTGCEFLNYVNFLSAGDADFQHE